MEIRDPVHGSIHILSEEVPIISHPFFQRLRSIKQLGFSEYVFPGATHTRYIHSIGVMSIGERAFNKLFADKLNHPEFGKLKQTLKLACLLHDIGHAPLSHATEFVMPLVNELGIASKYLGVTGGNKNRQATHEDYTIKAIVDSSFSESFAEVEKKFKVQKERIADLVIGHTSEPAYFTLDGVNYFKLLSKLVSGEMDCDRMDYLLRDSYFCGVSYGQYDLDWLLDNLEACIIGDEAYLGISERAVVTFDDFLLSRFHMFVMVYFHYRSVCLEQQLMKYFQSSPEEYKIPSNIEEYIEHDDYFLMKALRKSQNPYAQSIVRNQIPAKIFESFNEGQLKTLERIQNYLDAQKIDYIRGSSAGRLSKYYSQSRIDEAPIKVVRNYSDINVKQYFDIADATDLFQKFSKSHEVNRLHCNFASLKASDQKNILDIIKSSL